MPLVKHNQSCVILKIVRLKSNASNDLTIIIFFVSIKNVFINGVMCIYVCAVCAAKMQWYICDWQVNAYGYSYTSCFLAWLVQIPMIVFKAGDILKHIYTDICRYSACNWYKIFHVVLIGK
jgi:hypothetical protein